MLSRAYRIAFAIGVTAFGVSFVAGLGFGFVDEGSLPTTSGKGAPELSLMELRTQAMIQPRNPVMLASVAAALDARGDEEGAIEVYEATLRINPAAVKVHGKLASLYQRTGRIEEGRTQAQISVRMGVPVDHEVLRALGFRPGDR